MIIADTGFWVALSNDRSERFSYLSLEKHAPIYKFIFMKTSESGFKDFQD